MKRSIGLAAALLAGMSGVAAAQVLVPVQQPVVVTPAPAPVVVSPQPTVIQSGTVVTTTTQPVIVSRVYAPQGVIIQTNVDQPAPFNPAPVGTVIETTAGARTVQAIRGYDVVYDEAGKTVVSHAMLTDGLGGDGTFSNTAVENFWPLQVGKSDTFNYNTSEGGRAVTLKVLRTEIVTVPAGQFYTYVIERRDRRPSDGTENVATMWYAPSVGSVVKFQEEVGRATKPRPPYEATAIRLPQALTGTTVVQAVRRVDTVEMQSQFCRERGTTLRLADGRTLVLDCPSYVQADRLAYENWLLVR
jgi:hypothetical protein